MVDEVLQQAASLAEEMCTCPSLEGEMSGRTGVQPLRPLYLSSIVSCTVTPNRGNALTFCFCTIPDAKPLRTSAGIALIRRPAKYLLIELAQSVIEGGLQRLAQRRHPFVDSEESRGVGKFAFEMSAQSVRAEPRQGDIVA